MRSGRVYTPFPQLRDSLDKTGAAQKNAPMLRRLGITQHNLKKAADFIENARVLSEYQLRTKETLVNTLRASYLLSDLALLRSSTMFSMIATAVQQAAAPPFGAGQGLAVSEVLMELYLYRFTAAIPERLVEALKEIGTWNPKGSEDYFFQLDCVVRIDDGGAFRVVTQDRQGKRRGNARPVSIGLQERKVSAFRRLVTTL